MSSTNRAFIKAYRHDTPQGEPAAAGPAKPVNQARPARALANAPRQFRWRATASTQTLNTARQSRTFAPVAPEKRPLSSYLSTAPTAPESRPRESEDGATFQPGTTVASFQWPAVCRLLTQKCGTQLDQVTRLLWARASAGNSLIGVFGLFCGSGATSITLCLASRAATRGRRVVVGDGNFRNPQLTARLEAVPTAGWEEVLKHSAPLHDAVIRATDENLDVLALGNKLLSDPLPVVGGLQAAVTAGILRHAYDLSILDLGTFLTPCRSRYSSNL